MPYQASDASAIPEALLSTFRDFLLQRLGWSFPESRQNELFRGTCGVAEALGFRSVTACVEHLCSRPWTRDQVETLATLFTVGETYFFRHRQDFETLRDEVLMPLIKARQYGTRQLRCWSAGCCSGEEPYTLATYLDELIPNVQDWQVTIQATDINPRFLAKARRAEYSDWSFRETPDTLRRRYFDAVRRKRSQLIPRIRRMAQFGFLNLADHSYPSMATNTSDMDVILCRNVLIYFAPHQARGVLERLAKALAADGVLLVSPCETAMVPTDVFERQRHGPTTLFRKPKGRKRAAVSVARPVGWSAVATDSPWVGSGATRGGGSAVVAPGKPTASERRVHANASVTGTAVDARPLAETAAAATHSGTSGAAARCESDVLAAATTLYGQGHYEAAAGLLTEALDDASPAARWQRLLPLLVRALSNQGRNQDALWWCRRAVRVVRFAPSLYYLQGTLYQDLGDAGLAQDAFRRVLYLDPDHILAHVMLGSATRQQGDSRSAVRFLRRALELLGDCDRDETLPDSEDMTAGQLSASIRILLEE